MILLGNNDAEVEPVAGEFYQQNACCDDFGKQGDSSIRAIVNRTERCQNARLRLVLLSMKMFCRGPHLTCLL